MTFRRRRPVVSRHRLTPQQVLDIPDGLTPEDDRRRYFHDVGMASRVRVHRDLATEHDRCPMCAEDLTP